MAGPPGVAPVSVPRWLGDLANKIAAAMKPTAVSDLKTPPANPAAAPLVITVPAALNTTFQRLWSESLPGGVAHERGGTLARDKTTGEVTLVNEGGHGSTTGTFSPKLTVDATKYEMVGAFHTHPYAAAEGGMRNVAFSGGDIVGMINDGTKVEVVQSGDTQFMLVRTGETPASVDGVKMNTEWEARFRELQRDGKSYEEASRIAAREYAAANKIAYYEGSGGTFTRVSP